MKKTIEGHTLTVEIDDDPFDPRDYEDCIKIAAWHKRYYLGDPGLGYPKWQRGGKGDYFKTPAALLAHLTGMSEETARERAMIHEHLLRLRHYVSMKTPLDKRMPLMERNSFGELVYQVDYPSDADIVAQYLAEFSKTHFWLPVYLLDHSGLRMNCGGFGCPWDSGQVGFVYISKAQAAAELENGTEEKALEQMRNAVETYSDYLAGSVYRWSLTGPNGEHIDSNGNYIGDEKGAESDGMDALNEAVAEFRAEQDKEEAAEAEREAERFARVREFCWAM